MDLYLGVDGGQSATKAVIGDSSGRVLGRGTAGPCNHVGAAAGRAKLEGAVSGAVGRALADADLRTASVFRAACFGMSGGPADKNALLRALIPAENAEVTTDAHIALDGALAAEPGAVVIAGTGSIALGRNADGRTARAGGWGYVFGDEGGGFDTVRQALRAALRMEEGWGPETALRAALLDAARAADINELMHDFYTVEWPRERIAGLLPIVADTAAKGDPEASSILVEAGERLAVYARGAVAQLFSTGGRPPVSYVGGAFRAEATLSAFRDALTPDCEIVSPRFGPDLGALLGAYRLVGLQVELQP